MNNEPKIDIGDDDLERRIEELESDEWFRLVKGLKPAQSLDLYLLGYEASKQPAQVSSQTRRFSNPRWFHVQTALISSVISVAATLLIMFQFSRSSVREATSLEVSSHEEKIDPSSKRSERKQTWDSDNVARTKNQEFGLLLNGPTTEKSSDWRERLQITEIEIANADDSNRVVEVAPSHSRYAIQRRQLIEDFRERFQ